MNPEGDKENAVERVRLYREGRAWRWAYEYDGMQLASNDSYETAEEAQRTARIAYPDTLMEAPVVVE